MAIKIKRILPMLLTAAVLFSACSKAEESDTDEEIWSITGYYMRTDYSNFCVYEQSLGGNTEIFYEPLEIHFEGDEQGDVPMDSLKTGDKIEVDVKFILESYPPIAPIYGLRFIEEGDISNIDNSLLLHLEEMGYHAVIGKKTEQPPVTRNSGYFVRTETECFLVSSEEYGMLAGIDLLKIHPVSDVEAADIDVSEVSLDGFKTGDRIWVDIMLVQELYPPISPIYGAVLIEAGDISDISPSVISKLEELGYTVV